MNILITGVSSGIGKYLSENIKNSYITGVSRTNIKNNKIDHIVGDLRNTKTLENISKNNYDYIIINAGVGYFDEFKNISLEENRELLETNLLSPILLISMLLNKNKINLGIIFIGSIAGKKSMKLGASYAASKFGLRGFAMQLKNELKGLKINLINPKIVKTNFHKNSKIDIQGKYNETKLEDILKIIENIINGNENRFEIDL